jgi:hypothetical protein
MLGLADQSRGMLDPPADLLGMRRSYALDFSAPEPENY